MSNFTQKKIIKANGSKKGDLIVINNKPYKIIELIKSKTGKHGICKIHIMATDIFNDKKIQTMFNSSDNVEITEAVKKDYQLIDISGDDFLIFMLENGTTRSDIMIPKNEIGNGIKNKFNEENIIWITILSSLNIEEIISFKIMKD